MPDQSPKNATKTLIEWLQRDSDDAAYWAEEAQAAWERAAALPAAKRLATVKAELAQVLENHVVDAAPEDGGKFWGDLSTDSIEHIDWEVAAESLLNHVVTSTAA